MITKIISLKNDTLDNSEVQSICENALASLSSAAYQNVPGEAKYEIEKYTINTLFEQLSSIKDPKVSSWLVNEQRLYTIKNLDLRTTINKMIKENTHTGVSYILNNLKTKLDTTPDIFMFEEVISALSGYNYLPAVSTGLNAISDRVSKYKNDLDITKVLETMKATKSNYIVPLIEQYIENYLSNKTEQNKSFLKEALMKFSYDPFVTDMINILTLDASQLQLEHTTNSIVESIYSPLFYNEEENNTIFNVKGMYYVKDGNNITKLNNKIVESLDVDFINLCNILNDNSVKINENNIKIYQGNNIITINESQIDINGNTYDANSYNNLEYASAYSRDINSNMYKVIKLVFENYNNIAEIDFVKHVAINENLNNTYNQFDGKSADIFKLRDKIFITTHDNMNKSTFYRNVNPIQAKNIMMEHLRYDVSKAFKDILPKEERILREMEESKAEYVKYIEMLESKLVEFNGFKDITDLLQDELNETKSEYKQYLAICEKYTRPSEYYNSVNELLNEELTISIKNDKTGQSHTVIIPDEITNGIQTGDNQAGSIVGAENVQQDASAVTFDADQSAQMQNANNIKLPTDTEKIEQEADDAEEEAEENQESDDTEDSDSDINVDSEDSDNSDEEDVDLSLDTDDKEEKKEKKKKNEGAKPKVFLKKKLNESVQIGDDVIVNGKKGSVTAKINNKIIVAIQGSTVETDDAQVIKTQSGEGTTNKTLIKFDELTQKVLFEQFVKCGVYMNNIPVKTQNCFVNYSTWNSASEGENISIMIENQLHVLPKNQIKILENVNDFANPSNYAKGKITNLNETILYNITDYNNSIGSGTANQIRIIKLSNDWPNSIEYMSASNISID